MDNPFDVQSKRASLWHRNREGCGQAWERAAVDGGSGSATISSAGHVDLAPLALLRFCGSP